jgi:hypothetical protein
LVGMAEPPELWAFVLTNIGVLLTGGVLTALSVHAYRQDRKRSFGVAAVSFGLITAGGVIEAVYQIGIRGGYQLGGRELLTLQAIQSVIIAAGLGLLFYSLTKH